MNSNDRNPVKSILGAGVGHEKTFLPSLGTPLRYSASPAVIEWLLRVSPNLELTLVVHQIVMPPPSEPTERGRGDLLGIT